MQHLEPNQERRLAEQKALSTGLSNVLERTIPTEISYNDIGSALYQELTHQPEYYLTRTEQKLLESYSSQIVNGVGDCNIVELGAGDSGKTNTILSTAINQNLSIVYAPIDINGFVLETATKRLRNSYPSLNITPICGDNTEILSLIKNGKIPSLNSILPRVYLFLGSSFGNFESEGRNRFLSMLHDTMREQDRLIVSVDLFKNPKRICAAYNDAKGVLARMERSSLSYINSTYHGNFRLENFEHYSVFDAKNRYVESRLFCTKSQQIEIGDIHLNFFIDEGESLLCDKMWKPTKQELISCFDNNNFHALEEISNPRTPYLIVVAKKAEVSCE